MKLYFRLALAALACLTLTFCASAPIRHPAVHPAYLHALDDLRGARWMIEHRPGDWARTVDEVETVRQIDIAINDIKQAAIDDGRNIDSHPKVDERPAHKERLREALAFLRKARADVAQEEDNADVRGLRNRSLAHIDAAIKSAQYALND